MPVIKPLNKRQEAQLNMVQTTDSVFDQYARIVGSIPALRRHAARLRQLKTMIADTSGNRIAGNGATSAKTANRKLVASALQEVSGTLLSYANETGDHPLQTLVNYAPSDFEKLRDGDFPIVARRILGEARSREAILTTDWGLDPQTLVDLEANIGRFDEDIPAPARAIQTRAITSADVKGLFSQVNILLHKSLDPLLRGLRKKHPDLFAAYTAARVIRDNPTRSGATPTDASAAAQ